MVHKILTLGALSLALLISLPALPDESGAVQREAIYGWHLMTRQERARDKDDMLRLQSEAERRAYRQRHRQMIWQRAKRLGIQLPPVPALEEDETDDRMSGRRQR